MSAKYSFATRAIHSGHDPDKHMGSINVPIYQTTIFKHSDIAKKHNKLTIVDNTFMTPYFQNLLEWSIEDPNDLINDLDKALNSIKW